VLDREDCLAANSRSTGPQQQNTDDQTDQTVAQNDQLPLTGRLQMLVDDQQCRLLVKMLTHDDVISLTIRPVAVLWADRSNESKYCHAKSAGVCVWPFVTCPFALVYVCLCVCPHVWWSDEHLKPVITLQPETQVALKDGTLNLTCRAVTSSHSVLTVLWKKDHLVGTYCSFKIHHNHRHFINIDKIALTCYCETF